MPIPQELIDLALKLDTLPKEEQDRVLDELLRIQAMPIAEDAALEALAEKARTNVSVESFLAYCELKHGEKMPEHNIKAVKDCFKAHDIGKIFLLLGARGFRKTSTLSMDLDEFLLGHHPNMTGLIVGATPENPDLIAKSIALTIEFHPEWKRAFPYVVPDTEKGWGAEGYWVRDSRMLKEEWVQKQAKAGVKDPSFVGGGYGSSRINGLHPSLFLDADDIHDIKSSGSEAERSKIKKAFLSQILKTVIYQNDKFLTWVNVIGVPFSKDDTYHTLRESGQCVFHTYPCMIKAAENDSGAIFIDGVNQSNGATYEDIVGWWLLTWPNFGIQSIISARSFGKSSFWQMYMVDIDTAKTSGLRYYLYEHENIDRAWMTVGGVDPTNVARDSEVGGSKRSAFALCYLSKLPQGGAVVVDGVLKPCGIEESKGYILDAQTMFPNWWTTGVENVGGGAVYLQYLGTDPRVKKIASNLTMTGTGKVKSKKDRINLELSPWLENMTIRISDANTPFLNALRQLFDNFFDEKDDFEGWDAADSLYHAAKLIPDVLRVSDASEELPSVRRNKGNLWTPWSGPKEGVVHGR